MGLLLSAMVSSACTTISIYADEDQVHIERNFGFATVSLAPGVEPLLVESRSFGLARGSAGITAGYVSERVAVLPASCQVVLWVDAATSLVRWRELLLDLDDICSVDSGGKR
ncbi:MAG TPA: hypothetical protein VF322_09770 [Gammaproteobacteria bacterium]